MPAYGPTIPGANTCADADATVYTEFPGSMAGTNQETADDYGNVVLRLAENFRVIISKDDIQWILQRRKNGVAQRPWRSLGYFLTRKALMRVSAAHGAPSAPLTCLPERFYETLGKPTPVDE